MGVHRRSSHNLQKKLSSVTTPSSIVAVAGGVAFGGAGAGKVVSAAEKPASATRVGGGGRHAQGLKPEPREVLSAIDSLYVDQLKPFGRIVRKRIAERAMTEAVENVGRTATDAVVASVGFGGGDPLPDVDIKHLRAVCESCDLLLVESEEGGDWSAVFRGRPQPFVNVYSPQDDYPTSLWNNAAAYFAGLGENEMNLPGARYSCAQALINRKLHFLSDYSLGQVCHIVQLAISQKKLLGYSSGCVVPYHHSQSMVKERCAHRQQPCATMDGQNAMITQAMPLATWEMAHACLREILDSVAVPGEGPATLPLSNIKRLFRSKYHVELSETTLGHSKLSELLQDEHFSDVCMVQLQGPGYIVVQRQRLPSSTVLLAKGNAMLDPVQECQAHEPQRFELCPDDPFHREDVELSVEVGLSFAPFASPGMLLQTTTPQTRLHCNVAAPTVADTFRGPPISRQRRQTKCHFSRGPFVKGKQGRWPASPEQKCGALLGDPPFQVYRSQWN